MRQSTDEAIHWLLDGDPSIRWQTLRDLVGASEGIVERERRKIARDGWGKRLLAKQDPEGTWARGQSSDGGLYSPKWTSTTYTMLLLRDFGLAANNRPARLAVVGRQTEVAKEQHRIGRRRPFRRVEPTIRRSPTRPRALGVLPCQQTTAPAVARD